MLSTQTCDTAHSRANQHTERPFVRAKLEHHIAWCSAGIEGNGFPDA
jgi:hypothetical protein